MRTARIFTLTAALLALGLAAGHAPRAAAAAGDAYCASAVAHQADRALTPGAGAVRGCRYDIGLKDVSPSIGVTRRGVLFVGKSSGGVRRSTDGGRTWQDIAIPAHANGDSHAKGVHGYVHVDPVTDRVYYLTSMSAASCRHGGGVVSWSDDLGATWAGSTVGCNTYDWGRLVTGVGPHGGRAVYYFGVAPRPVGGLRPVYRSLDGGKTWTRTRNVASVTTESGVGVTAPDGTIYFDYPEFLTFEPDRILNRTYPFQPANLCRAMIAVSEDFGDTWRQASVPGSHSCNSNTGQQRVAVDAAGTVYAVWTDDHDSQVRLAVSRDKGRTWSTPINVTPPGTTFNNSFANVIAGRPGHIVISTMNTTAAKNPRWWMMQGKGVWHSYLTQSFDAAGAAPHFQSVDLDPPNDPGLVNGESPTEAEGYMGMSPSDETWAVFAYHGHGVVPASAKVVAARFQN